MKAWASGRKNAYACGLEAAHALLRLKGTGGGLPAANVVKLGYKYLGRNQSTTQSKFEPLPRPLPRRSNFDRNDSTGRGDSLETFADTSVKSRYGFRPA